MPDPTLRQARSSVEALRGYADLAYYRPSQHMTADEYADALKAYAVVMGFLDVCTKPNEPCDVCGRRHAGPGTPGVCDR